jgi:hypothetical protein
MTLEEKFISKNQMSHISKCLVALHMYMFLMKRNQNYTQKLKNVSSLNIPWNRKDINVSTLPVESCK